MRRELSSSIKLDAMLEYEMVVHAGHLGNSGPDCDVDVESVKLTN